MREGGDEPLEVEVDVLVADELLPGGAAGDCLVFNAAHVDVARAIRHVDSAPVAHRVARGVGIEDAELADGGGPGAEGAAVEAREADGAGGAVEAGAAALEVDEDFVGGGIEADADTCLEPSRHLAPGMSTQVHWWGGAMSLSPSKGPAGAHAGLLPPAPPAPAPVVGSGSPVLVLVEEVVEAAAPVR